ncbi:hypothetical protein WR25_05491 [Diploscapter pachys]|uniref:GYF domain-containing protein n=1 Tax=Diploscapter pachys TaxID=2018661 RepID=A0A2A2LWV0_9BILA|nr:hypothetical protein WR25_05491 [Diploscapter pachys]
MVLADVLWYYIGIDEQTYGPHTSYEMLYWAKIGAMPDMTPLKTTLDTRWHLMLEWKRQSGGKWPFVLPIRSMAHLQRRAAELKRREEVRQRRIEASLARKKRMAQLATSYYHARRMAAGADYSHPKGKKAHIPKWAQQVRSTIAKRVRGAAPKKKWDRLNSGTVRLELQDHVVVPASCSGVNNNNNNTIVVDSKDNDYDNTSALFAKLMINEKRSEEEDWEAELEIKTRKIEERKEKTKNKEKEEWKEGEWTEDEFGIRRRKIVRQDADNDTFALQVR